MKCVSHCGEPSLPSEGSRHVHFFVVSRGWRGVMKCKVRCHQGGTDVLSGEVIKGQTWCHNVSDVSRRCVRRGVMKCQTWCQTWCHNVADVGS